MRPFKPGHRSLVITDMDMPPLESWDRPCEVLVDMAAEILLIRGMSTDAGLPIRCDWLKKYGELRGVHGLEGYGADEVPGYEFAIDALQTVCRAQITQRFVGYLLTDDLLVQIGNAATRYMERWTLIGRWKVTAHQYAVNVPDRVVLHFERKDG